MEKKKLKPVEESAKVLLYKPSEELDLKTIPLKEKMKYLKSNITVEPIVLLFMVPSVLSLLATQNLYIDKACRVNLQFSETVCRDLQIRKLDNHTFEEIEVQKLVASVQAWKSIGNTSVATLLILFVGAWSDKTGRRKICMLVPIFAELMTCILNIVNTYFFYQISMEWTVIIDLIVPSLTGGWYTMFLGSFSYLCDITSKETRTFRLGILNLCLTIGYPIGMGFSGVLLKYLGYYGVFSIAAGTHILNFFYLHIGIEDHTWLENKDKKRRTGFIGFLLEFFDLNSFKETIGILFKKGRNNRRLKFFLLLICVCLHYGPQMGETSIIYIFLRFRFNWDEIKYSIYSTYSLILHSIGTIFAICIFSKKLKAHDSILGITSMVSKILGTLVIMFAIQDYQAYLYPLVEMLYGTTSIALRSLCSKLVSHQELGRLNSLVGVVETLMPVVYAPLYSRIYIATIDYLPGVVFLLSIVSSIPVLVIFSWIYHQHRKGIKKKGQNVTTKASETNKNEEGTVPVAESHVECLLHEHRPSTDAHPITISTS
ncbi:unnamed protein product [Parnassius apollo]|uniref:(apollo) hypothetical protein n=1 Tax=Parnassius apollo TaxID=110799 RepID=A0A8S3YB89_PARAO|nr:unnamed protein product [Parnassius apollo]